MTHATFEYDRQLNLKPEQRALLFTKLSEMTADGLPCAQVVSTLLHTEAKLKKPLSLMLRRVNAGCALSEAGFRSGIFNEGHKTLLHAAESSGQLAEVYGQLAAYYSELAIRNKKVKSRLYLPALVLCLALLAQFLPAIINMKLGVETRAGLQWVTLVICGVSILANPFTKFLLVDRPSKCMLLVIPLTKNWIVKRELTGFFFILGMILNYGVAFDEALPKAVACIKNPIIRKKFDTALDRLGEGANATGILSSVPVINPAQLQMLDRSEQSGKLASGLLDYVNLEAEYMSHQDDALAGWLSRLIYSLVAVWMVYFVLMGQFAKLMQNL